VTKRTLFGGNPPQNEKKSRFAKKIDLFHVFDIWQIKSPPGLSFDKSRTFNKIKMSPGTLKLFLIFFCKKSK
jgi:hypothetical protein